uniref:G-protein coupled receptors family 1 profile domain-containing protein n=1 Tax=Plectus sambesii TaxID=2011161 RepID=A0A914WCU1_9BILA
MCLGNGAIFLAVFSSRSMRNRKEMLLVAGLAVTDFIYGLGTMLAGAMRSWLQYTGHLDDPVTPWACMGFPSTVMFAVGQQTMVTVQTSSSYFLTERVANQRAVCFGPMAVPAWYSSYDLLFAPICGYISVAIYGGVVVAYRRHVRSTVSVGGYHHDANLKTQKRLTITLGIISFFTLVFYCTPFCLTNSLTWAGLKLPNIYNQMAGIIIRINSVVNLFVYIKRQPDIRNGLLKVVTCSTLGNGGSTHVHSISQPLRR